jgi:gamma-glutamylcyclotransferase (GGCT)/AIG2-like uncharacterized protein YtfP
VSEPPRRWTNRDALVVLLQELNHLRVLASAADEAEQRHLEAAEETFDRPTTRLAVYGTLAPGASNAWVLEDLAGTWTDGTVRGVVDRTGRYPVFRWDEHATEEPVRIFTSASLPEAWPRLDAFEGAAYRRVLVPVTCDGRLCVCNAYEGR